jgi:hypothetical protein
MSNPANTVRIFRVAMKDSRLLGKVFILGAGKAHKRYKNLFVRRCIGSRLSVSYFSMKLRFGVSLIACAEPAHTDVL